MGEKEIHCLQEYLGWVKELRDSGDYFPINNIFFRGQADETWEIKPSIYRDNYNEHKMLNIAKIKGAPFLKDCKTDLEILITLQHYGLPTRILDVTTNPLVALYFACHKENSKNGRVLWGHYNNMYERVYAEIVAQILFLTDFYGGNMATKKQIVDLLKYTSCKSQRKTCLQMFTKSLFFFPPYVNPRIIAQSGAFLMSALIKKWDDDTGVILNSEYEGVSTISNKFENNYVIIPAEKKDELLLELDKCGINQATLFPDLQNLTEYIKNSSGGGLKFDDTM